MAVKKTEKGQKKHSENSESRKASSAVATKSVATKSKDKGGAQVERAKVSQTKMKSVEIGKEAKAKVSNLPVAQQIAKTAEFLAEVRAESRKINWPERAQVIRETVSVLFLVTLITIFVWAFDLGVGKFIFAPLEHWGHLYGIGGGA